MKEIVVTGGITAPSGYLITKALFAAKPSLARSLAYRHVRLGLEDRLNLGIPCAMRFGSTPAMTSHIPLLIFRQEKPEDFAIVSGIKYMPAISSALPDMNSLSIIGGN